MNLAAELNNKSNELENKEDKVINEIVEYFRVKLNDEDFPNRLKQLFYDDNYRTRRKELVVEFWDYTSGCSDTNFYASGVCWKNPEGRNYDSWYYKGIRLVNIQRKVGPKILSLYKNNLEELGFSVYSQSDESWLGYYKQKVVITW